jgi:hypothetical protein
MGPVARARLAWAVAVVPRTGGTRGIFDTEAGVNVWVFSVWVIVEGLASNAVRMMVMVMVIRAGHQGRRMLECNVLAREWFCSVQCVRVRARVSVPMIGRSAAEGSAMRKGTVMRKGTAMRTGRSTSSSQSSATVMAASATGVATSATCTAAATTMTTAAAATMTAPAPGGT